MTAHGAEEVEARTIAADVLDARSTAVGVLGFDGIE